VKTQMFDELVASIKQAGEIHRGEVNASRRFVFEPEAVRQCCSDARERRSSSCAHDLRPWSNDEVSE
jgi:hypothetical protein